MITERRFLTGFRSADADTPGLVQEDDGTVWLVAPDGTRTQISGGGSLPAEWTIGPDAVNTSLGSGGLSILLTESGRALELIGTDPLDHDFYVDLDVNPKFGLQMTTGAEFRVESDASVYLYGRDNGSSNPWMWFYRDDGAGGKRVTIDLRSDAANRLTILDDAGAAVYQVKTDGSVHVKTGASTAMVADL